MKDNYGLKIGLLDKILGENKTLEHESIEKNFIDTLQQQDNKIYKQIINIITDTALEQKEKNKQITFLLENIDKRVDSIELNIKKNNYGFKINISFNIKTNNVNGYIVFNIRQ